MLNDLGNVLVLNIQFYSNMMKYYWSTLQSVACISRQFSKVRGEMYYPRSFHWE